MSASVPEASRPHLAHSATIAYSGPTLYHLNPMDHGRQIAPDLSCSASASCRFGTFVSAPGLRHQFHQRTRIPASDRQMNPRAEAWESVIFPAESSGCRTIGSVRRERDSPEPGASRSSVTPGQVPFRESPCVPWWRGNAPGDCAWPLQAFLGVRHSCGFVCLSMVDGRWFFLPCKHAHDTLITRS